MIATICVKIDIIWVVIDRYNVSEVTRFLNSLSVTGKTNTGIFSI